MINLQEVLVGVFQWAEGSQAHPHLVLGQFPVGVEGRGPGEVEHDDKTVRVDC